MKDSITVYQETFNLEAAYREAAREADKRWYDREDDGNHVCLIRTEIKLTEQKMVDRHHEIFWEFTFEFEYEYM